MHLEDGENPVAPKATASQRPNDGFRGPSLRHMALELDDGAEVLLSPGDVLIETELATVGAWFGDVPATLASFIIGARRVNGVDGQC